MKKASFLSITYIFLAFLLVNCGSDKTEDPTPAVATGNASANFNGTAWKGEWTSSLLGGTGMTQTLAIILQLTEKDNSEVIGIGISSFTGVKTYTYGGTTNQISFTIKYKGKNYTLNTVGANRGAGTIKITEYAKSNGILNPGKVVGEFSGTLKTGDGSETITITNGKFTSILY